MKLQEVIDQVNWALDRPISLVELGIQTTLTTQTNTITGILNAQTLAIQNTLNAFTASVQASLVALETGAQTSLNAAAQLKKTAEEFAWRITASPSPVLSGETVTLSVQGIKALNVVLSVYNHEDEEIVAGEFMDENPLRPGNYTYELEITSADFAPGRAFTFVATEVTTGGLAAGSNMVESVSLSAVAGLAAAAPGAESAAKKALAAVEEMKEMMSKGGDLAGIQDEIADVKETIEALPNMIADAIRKEGSLGEVKQVVNNISSQLAALAGDEPGEATHVFRKTSRLRRDDQDGCF